MLLYVVQVVPFQHKDRQQYWNALPLENAGAARIIEQNDLTPEAIADTLENWDRHQLMLMAEKAQSVAITDATERVANVIIEVAKK